MGYYSKVSVLCGKNVADRIVALPSIYGARIRKRDDGLFRFYWNDVKWPQKDFKNNTDADAIMEIVNESISKLIDDKVEGCKMDFCSFIRIGDDCGDVEHYNNSASIERQWVKTDFDIMDDWNTCPNYGDFGHSVVPLLKREGIWDKCTK